jgi:glycosyltransferase involved in cell wall biosynthesis
LHVTFSDVDVVLMVNVANSIYAWLPRLAGKPTILNVDGLDRKRGKWGAIARAFLLFCEIVSVVTPTRVVTDALTIQQYFKRRYRKSTEMIAYGAEAKEVAGDVTQFGVKTGQYFLYVSRLEPENNPELVIRAYSRVKTDWPLVVVGDNRYRTEYERELRKIADPRVIFTGAVYGDGYWLLQRNAGAYVSGCRVGGTHPALIEAMISGNAVAYVQTPEGDEVVDGTAISFEENEFDLAAKLQTLFTDATLRAELGRRAQMRARDLYSWEAITTQYENLFYEVLGDKAAAQLRRPVDSEALGGTHADRVH